MTQQKRIMIRVSTAAWAVSCAYLLSRADRIDQSVMWDGTAMILLSPELHGFQDRAPHTITQGRESPGAFDQQVLLVVPGLLR